MCREDGRGPCDTQSVTYDIKCDECNDILSHWPKRKRGQPYGSTVKRNTTVKCRNLK